MVLNSLTSDAMNAGVKVTVIGCTCATRFTISASGIDPIDSIMRRESRSKELVDESEKIRLSDVDGEISSI